MTFCANTGDSADADLTGLQRPVSQAGFLSHSPFDPLRNLLAKHTPRSPSHEHRNPSSRRIRHR